MYIFGQSVSDVALDETTLRDIFRQADERTRVFADIPITSVIDALHELGKTWREGGDHWNEALRMSQRSLPFSVDMLKRSLAVIPDLLSRKNILDRICADFGSVDKLDRFVRSDRFFGRERAFPLGKIFHVSAGNVFLGAIDSLLMGFLTKNISVVKLSSRNIEFPLYFARSLQMIDREGVIADKFALLHFPGGSVSLEAIVKQEANGIIAWGGEEMIVSYKTGLGLGVKFFEYGPKISFQVITAAALAKYGYRQTAQWIAQDIAMWDQAACASPQNLFLESTIDPRPLMSEIAQALVRFPLARGRLTDDEFTEVLKEKARAQYNKIMSSGEFLDGDEFFLHFEDSGPLRPSPLNRTLILKRYQDSENLISRLQPFARHLQSCSLLALESEKDDLITALGHTGVMRFASLGSVMEAPVGAPHDGRLSLLDLTRLVPEEDVGSLESFVNQAIASVPFYGRLRQGRFVETLEDMPLIRGSDLDASCAEKLAEYTRDDISGGYVFSSGGTSASPKYMMYAHDEFKVVADLLATAFRAQGVKHGSLVANLFVAGNLWSSFLAVDQAMARIGARVLPIGGTTDKDLVVDYLVRFKPEFVVGLPTQIVEIARRSVLLRRQVRMPVVLYAGEHLSLASRRFLEEVVGTQHFGSAGYASVDAGPIGYQCRCCSGTEHHLFASHVHLEVINGEAVVTSKVRKLMPVIRLQTGDLVEWVGGSLSARRSDEPGPREQSECACGSTDPKFALMGRVDSQFNVWACRLFVSDFEKAIADCHPSGVLFQIHIEQDEDAQERIVLYLETSGEMPVDKEHIKDKVYHYSRDLQSTHPRDWLDQRLAIQWCQDGGIPRVGRTGKIKQLIDHRLIG